MNLTYTTPVQQSLGADRYHIWTRLHDCVDTLRDLMQSPCLDGPEREAIAAVAAACLDAATLVNTASAEARAATHQPGGAA